MFVLYIASAAHKLTLLLLPRQYLMARTWSEVSPYRKESTRQQYKYQLLMPLGTTRLNTSSVLLLG